MIVIALLDVGVGFGAELAFVEERDVAAVDDDPRLGGLAPDAPEERGVAGGAHGVQQDDVRTGRTDRRHRLLAEVAAGARVDDDVGQAARRSPVEKAS